MSDLTAAAAPDLLSRRAGRREVLLGGALVLTGLGSGLLARGASVTAPAQAGQLALPATVGPWSRSAAEGVLIPKGEEPGEEVYDDVVTGYYTSAGEPPVMLLIAYGSAQTGTTQLHRPEVCYPAAGFKVHKGPNIALDLPGKMIAARTMTATAVGRVEQILYWSRVGRDYPTSTNDQRWSVLRNTLNGVVPDGALVRMSIIDPHRPAAMAALKTFAAALIETASPKALRLLTGPA